MGAALMFLAPEIALNFIIMCIQKWLAGFILTDWKGTEVSLFVCLSGQEIRHIYTTAFRIKKWQRFSEMTRHLGMRIHYLGTEN